MRLASHIAILLALIFWTAPKAIAGDPLVIEGIHGADDRQLVDSSQSPWSAVGRVNIKGYRKRQHCTGTLVSANQVLTAAHCLIDAKTQQPFATERIFFLAGLERGEHRELRKGKCVSFLSKGAIPYSSYRDDVALITLNDGLSASPTPILRRDGMVGEPLVHAGYTKDRPFSLAADETCSLTSQSGGAWFTDCDTNFGASGGPVMVPDGGQLKLGGIMIRLCI